MVRESEPIAQEPSRLEHARPDRVVFRQVHVVASSVELGEKILDQRMCLEVITDWSQLRQVAEQEFISWKALDRLYVALSVKSPSRRTLLESPLSKGLSRSALSCGSVPLS